MWNIRRTFEDDEDLFLLGGVGYIYLQQQQKIIIKDIFG